MTFKKSHIVVAVVILFFAMEFIDSFIKRDTDRVPEINSGITSSAEEIEFLSSTSTVQDPFETIENAIRRREDHVCIVDGLYDLHWADLGAMEYSSFWVKSFSHSYYVKDGHYYREYYFTYYPDLSDSDIAYMKQQLDEKVEYIKSCIPSGSSPFDTARIAHDILISDITYDMTFERDYNMNAYGGLIEGHAICSGYAASYCFVLNSLGIPCQIVQTDTHSYNRVGDAYVDVCWDDNDRVDTYGNPILSYYYFGMDYWVINSIEDHEIQYVTGNNPCNDQLIPYYYEYEGYTMAYFDYDEAVRILSDQYNKGVIVPTILFTNRDSYEEFANEMASDLWSILDDIGFTGEYCEYYQDDDKLTWGVGLSPSVKLDQY